MASVISYGSACAWGQAASVACASAATPRSGTPTSDDARDRPAFLVRLNVEGDEEARHHVVGGDGRDELDHLLRAADRVAGAREGRVVHGDIAGHLEGE